MAFPIHVCIYLTVETMSNGYYMYDFVVQLIVILHLLWRFIHQEQSSGDKAITNLSLRSKLKQLRFIGRMIGFAVCQDLLLDLHLSKPFVKQV